MAEMISGKVSSSIKNVPRLSESANILSSAECVFVAGYGADYALACEATDKLRSVARINASAYELGELDCTPFANDTVVLAVLTNPEFVHIATRYLRRIKSLGARVVIYTTETIEEVIDDFDFIYSVNDSVALFNHLPCITAIYKTAIIVAQEKKEIKDAG
jgi:glucosamine 6-phosphate synthetase-like amidotransferase/phosphosugar isomerase protein